MSATMDWTCRDFHKCRRCFLDPCSRPFQVQMFKHDHVRIVKNCYIDDELCRPNGDAVIDPVSPGPQARRFPRSVLLRLFDPVQCMRQTVFFSTGRLQKCLPATVPSARMTTAVAALLSPRSTDRTVRPATGTSLSAAVSLRTRNPGTIPSLVFGV